MTDAPLAFRSSPIKLFSGPSSTDQERPLKPSASASTSKLIIETPAVKKQEPKNEIQTVSTPVTKTGAAPSTGKLSALDKIRKQYQGNEKNGTQHDNLPLEESALRQAWSEYIIRLREEKNPAAQPFELALLRIRDENSFEAVTANNIEKQFIEQDRNKLFAFLQGKLQNRFLQFSVIVEEKTENRPVIETTMTSKEQFMKMAEQYPLVRELKDRLRLDLDY